MQISLLYFPPSFMVLLFFLLTQKSAKVMGILCELENCPPGGKWKLRSQKRDIILQQAKLDDRSKIESAIFKDHPLITLYH